VRRTFSIAATLAGLMLVASYGVPAGASTTHGGAGAAVRTKTSSSSSESYHESLCASHTAMCLDVYDDNIVSDEYVGHDEPSVLFHSGVPGSGNDITYKIKLPKEPNNRPHNNGSGGTWNFQLRPTFWFGLTLCDTMSSPEYTHEPCVPDTDANDFSSTDPNAPDYIGKHPGNAFMELQFYGPGYVPQFEGFGCAKHQYCAAMTIDSLELNQNNNKPNNGDCDNYILGGIEPINWAYITKDGQSQAPANPLFTGTFQNPNLSAVTPDYQKDLLMRPGDRIRIHMHDTEAGFRIDLDDLSSGQSGSMTASVDNGFGHILYKPGGKVCQEKPYAFHPMYSTANPRGTTWGAHTYNVSYSDEIGHFEHCLKLDDAFNCAVPADADASTGLDTDDDHNFCVPGSDSLQIHINGCFFSDVDFDGPSYQNRWPGTFADPEFDHQMHPTPLLFTSPTTNGVNYDDVAFETDLPRIESADNGGPGPFCDRSTGEHCVNPPPGANFYPIFSTRVDKGTCTWQEGGPFIPGTTQDFGGNSHDEFGDLLQTAYPSAGFTIVQRYNDFNNDLGENPCPVGT
jgi:hypothetical protein